MNEVKESSAAIDKSITESNKVRVKLMEEYNQFRIVCNDAAKFYIEISQIYNMSVAVFSSLFLKSLNTQEVLIYNILAF